MLRIARLLAAGLRMVLAAGRGQHYVVRGNLRPIRLMQVLADVDGIRVVGAVPFDGDRQWLAAQITSTRALRAPVDHSPRPANKSIAVGMEFSCYREFYGGCYFFGGSEPLFEVECSD